MSNFSKLGNNSAQIELTVASAAATYSSGDIVGAELTITGAARINGGTGKITGITVADYSGTSAAAELWITDTAVSEPSDNAAWSITDAESATVITVIKINDYVASAPNSVSAIGNLSIPFKCTSGVTSLYCCYVIRGAVTLIVNGIHLKIFVDQD